MQTISINGQGQQTVTGIRLDKNTMYTLQNATVSLGNKDCFLDIDFNTNQQGGLNQKTVKVTPPRNGHYSCTSQKYELKTKGVDNQTVLFNFKVK